MVGIAGKGKIEAILHPYQSLHRINRGRIHPYLTIPIHRHETKGWIDCFVDDGEIQPVSFRYRLPIVDAGATEGIHAQTYLRAANDIHIDHIGEISDVSIQVV